MESLARRCLLLARSSAEPDTYCVHLDASSDPHNYEALSYLQNRGRLDLCHHEDATFFPLLDAAAGEPIRFDPTSEEGFAPLVEAFKGFGKDLGQFVTDFDILDLDLRRCFDPITQRELLATGYLGELTPVVTPNGLDDLHYPLIAPVPRIAGFPRRTVYALAIPEELGRFHEIQNMLVPRTSGRQWDWTEVVAMEVLEGTVVKGVY